MRIRCLFILTLFVCTNSFSQTSPDEIPPTLEDSVSSALKVYERVEVEAEFPGGDKAWINFLTKNLNGQVPLDHDAPSGKYTVWVQFIVDKDGNVTDLKPLTSWGYGMEQEVMRILKIMPAKWTPAIQNGKPVKAYRKQPVTFVVSDDSFDVVLDKGKSALYIGIINPVTIVVPNVKDKNLSVTISQGTIEGSDGQYNVRVTKTGRAIITIYNKEKKIGAASFEVTNLSDSPKKGN